ncbi:GAF and ANTAR domain-containing protein [Leifsonia flava]|uniref:ANTAR domain-containing protein n=1 Tax=Orlajensenia leifsoniae TaxID=2561933 RepID=A0A4Y9R685_9MICO|nr:GAF and ANTAR domain-containing protein [Leifsonia flava]TFV99807.1 ANTAR domain-containing protein [Leifsonia flava]
MIDLCQPYTSAFSGVGAAVATLGDPFGSETLCASGTDAGLITELQIDLGEGPSWDAIATGIPVLEPTMHGAPSGAWPGLVDGLQSSPMRSLYAFPLAIGRLGIGAVILSADTAHALGGVDVDHAVELARATATQVLRISMARASFPGDDGDFPYSRREVHQATGMVIAQTGVPAEDAALMLRAHAFATGRSVREVAADVTSRRLVFDR